MTSDHPSSIYPVFPGQDDPRKDETSKIKPPEPWPADKLGQLGQRVKVNHPRIGVFEALILRVQTPRYFFVRFISGDANADSVIKAKPGDDFYIAGEPEEIFTLLPN